MVTNINPREAIRINRIPLSISQLRILSRIVVLLVCILPLSSVAQTTTTNYGNFAPCSGPIELYVFDFTATGSNTITQAGINIQNSDNECCSEPSNAGCLFFDVYIDPGATGVSFSQTGAGGNIDIYYDNCDSIYGANEDICLDDQFAYTDPFGNVYHRFMFCRSGQTTYEGETYDNTVITE